MAVRTYSVLDLCGNVSATFTQTITIDDTQAPVVTGTLTPTTVEGCDISALPAAATTVAQLEALGVTITDACTPDAQLTVQVTDGAPTGTCPLTVVRTYTVTDLCGNVSATFTQTITIDDTQAPAITGALTPVTEEGCDITSLPAAATTVAQLEALGVTITDACTPDAQLTVQVTDGAPTGTCPLTVVRTYTVTDLCGNVSATFTQTITVDDTQAPAVTGTLTPTTVEGCDITALPAEATTVAQLEALGVTINDACTPDAQLTVQVTDGAPTGTCPLTVVRTYTVTDLCGNVSATFTQTITIDDTQAPAITGTLTPATVEGCDITALPAAATTVAQLEALGVAITDACTPDAQLTVQVTD